MLVVALFTTFSALLIVAIPLPANHSPTAVDSNSHSTLYRRAPPKFEVPTGFVAVHHREDTIEKMTKHYETKSTDKQRAAGLASATSRWKDLHTGQEYMTFNYHAGDTTKSPVIPPMAKIYRDKPPPKTHFLDVPKEHRGEMELAGTKRYRDLSPDTARRVRSMKAWGDWHLDGGIREKTKLTFHSNISPFLGRPVGDPTEIYRPLTLQIPDVSDVDRFTINHEVRMAHKKMVADPQHQARTSNYGIVHSNWHDSLPDGNGKRHKQVIVGLEEVSENERERKHLGDYAVHMGTANYELVGPNAGGSSSHTAAGSHAGPLRVNKEVVHPSNSQEQHHLDVGSLSTHTLPPNSGSSLNSQGSQFNAGSPSSHPGPLSHPGPSHPELLHASSPQQQLQPHTGSPPLHNEFHVSSPELWRAWDPLSQPSHDTWQSLRHDLYSDQLWRTDLTRPPSNSHILPHANSPPLRPGLSSPISAQSSSAVPPNQQVGPSSNPDGSPHHLELLHPASQQSVQSHIGSPPLHNEFYMPSPEVWRPWDPFSQPSHDTWQSSHPDQYSDQLWHDPPNPQSPRLNS